MVAKPISRVAPIAALVSVLAGALAPTGAAAQACAMLQPGRPSDGPAASPDAQSQAIGAVTRALSGAGVTVIPPEDGARRMVGQPFAECASLDCGAEVVRSLGVDFAVLVTVWAPRGTPTTVVVTFIGTEDSAAGDAPVDGDVAAAAIAAFTTAHQRWQTSQMGYLQVSSEPAGAEVEVDGRAIGRTPVRRLVLAGQRRVRVALEGYEPVEQSVRVEPTQEVPLAVTLNEASGEDPVAPTTRTEPHVANWIIGGALVAGGIAALVSPIATLAQEGSCVDELPGDFCRTEVRFGAASGVLMGVGIAAIVGGAVFMIAQPITVEVTFTGTSGHVGLRGVF